MKKIMIALAALLPVFVGCKQNTAATQERDFHFSGDEVNVAASSPIARELVVEPVSAGVYDASFRTVGTVRPMAGRMAEVAVPFAGRITRSFVRLGDRVRAGQPVFEMSSPDFKKAHKGDKRFSSMRGNPNKSAVNWATENGMRWIRIEEKKTAQAARQQVRSEVLQAYNAYEAARLAAAAHLRAALGIE